MSKLYIVILTSILCYCTNQNVPGANAISIYKDILSFSIDTKDQVRVNETGIKIEIKLLNTSPDSIKISVPNCLGINIYPRFIDSEGDSLDLNFRLRIHCNHKMHSLDPNEELVMFFKYELNECYNLSKPGIYQLYFEYYSRIIDHNDKVMVDQYEIKSNKIWINVQE